MTNMNSTLCVFHLNKLKSLQQDLYNKTLLTFLSNGFNIFIYTYIQTLALPHNRQSSFKQIKIFTTRPLQ